MSKKGKGQGAEAEDQRTAKDTAQSVHELQVHQVELEMQGEELQKSRDELESLLARYTDLYDFAPVGYLTFDLEGAIRQVNLTGTQLLGVERSRLVNRRFGLLIAEGDRRVFSDFLQKVFAGQTRESCEVTLPQAGSQPLVARIECARSADGQECRAVVVDIAERKRTEEHIKEQLKELKRWQEAMLGREDRVQELKREVNELCRKTGQPVRYPSQEEGPDKNQY